MGEISFLCPEIEILSFLTDYILKDVIKKLSTYFMNPNSEKWNLCLLFIFLNQLDDCIKIKKNREYPTKSIGLSLIDSIEPLNKSITIRIQSNFEEITIRAHTNMLGKYFTLVSESKITDLRSRNRKITGTPLEKEFLKFTLFLSRRENINRILIEQENPLFCKKSYFHNITKKIVLFLSRKSQPSISAENDETITLFNNVLIPKTKR
jgi:hypothetical protein